MIKVTDFVWDGTILPTLRASSRDDALAELVAATVRVGAVVCGKELLAGLKQREEIMSTGLGGGIAIPHAWASEVKRVVIAVGRSHSGIDYQALDGRPVHLLFLLASPEEDPWRHLQILARISGLLRKEGVTDALLAAEDAARMKADIARYERAG